MQNLTKILICIQSRSTSQRLPNKCFEKIGPKRLLDHVIDSCKNAASYLNRHHGDRRKFQVETLLLIPYGDPIGAAFGDSIRISEGPELDVLDRFRIAVEKHQPDYICRITGDCPLIPPFVISKHITLGVVCEYDYMSNVDEECRVSLDGIDCEVMSRRMFDWLVETAETDEEKEHVTILARKMSPKWANRGMTASFFDQSGIKLSVDTPEDLEAVRKQYDSVSLKIRRAERLYGRHHIHRF